MSGTRDTIVERFAAWTALSGLRSGAPIKSRRDVYTALAAADTTPLFNTTQSAIDSAEFEAWHRAAIGRMMAHGDRLKVGWAAKIVNVYLKTRVYVGGQGRPGLASAIHPPIDAGLWLGLRRRFAKDRPDIIADTNCVARIKDITDYECYDRIIKGCRDAAVALGCDLIEVEQLWAGTEFE